MAAGRRPPSAQWSLPFAPGGPPLSRLLESPPHAGRVATGPPSWAPAASCALTGAVVCPPAGPSALRARRRRRRGGEAVPQAAVWPSPPVPAAASRSGSGTPRSCHFRHLRPAPAALGALRGRRRVFPSVSPAPRPRRERGVFPLSLLSGSFRFQPATLGQRFLLEI